MTGADATVDLRIAAENAGPELRHTLVKGHVLRVGRAPLAGLAVPWDKKISREHADIFWDGNRLHVKCLESARNPIIYNSQFARAASLHGGERFTIGATTFAILSAGLQAAQDEETTDSEGEPDFGADVHEQAFSSDQLRDVSFGNTDRQMELLAELPAMISGSESDEDLAARLAQLLLQALPAADGVAVARFDEAGLAAMVGSNPELPKPLMMRIETRPDFTGRFKPSRRLLLKTIASEQNAMHIWGDDVALTEYTMTAGMGWAFAAPILGDSCRGWCLYVSGAGSGEGAQLIAEEALKSDLRFTELVAQFIGAVRQVRTLQAEKTQLSSFLSPNVIKNLTGGEDVLTPAERDITVLFCDVRGFSHKSEQMKDDLHALLESVRYALGAMANGMLEHDGTIADFQGDAALGFWGWPVALELGPVPACRAALEIYRSFRRGTNDEESLLYGFSVGIGIAHGRAIAGQIGTSKQAKVGVFGPVVNQGARLEGFTRQAGVPICIDETTADWVKQRIPQTQARVRRLAKIFPKGMNEEVTVYALLPPEHEMPEVSETVTMLYDLALNAVIEKRWSEALQILQRIPDEDGPKHFLLNAMQATDNTPPEDWTGAFRLGSK